MKLLNCFQCGDVVALRFSERRCWCGKSSGRYLPGAKGTGIYSGPARILGIDNEDMRWSLTTKISIDEHGYSQPTWKWFVIPEGRNTLKLNG